MNNLIEGINLVKIFGEDSETITAVNDVSISIGSGELLVIMGESGSGKTTLFRAIGGSLKPLKGRILIRGREVSGSPPSRYRQGRLPCSPNS
jgi:ABC-type multidrug transport system ATPase subunit